MSSSSLTRLAVSAMAGVAVGFGLGAWYALRLGRHKVGEETNKNLRNMHSTAVCHSLIWACVLFLILPFVLNVVFVLVLGNSFFQSLQDSVRFFSSAGC